MPGESDAGGGHLRAFGSDRRVYARSVLTVPALARFWQARAMPARRARRLPAARGTYVYAKP